jgi:hypothetical protein
MDASSQPPKKSSSPFRKLVAAVLGLFLAYVGSYCINSAAGGYSRILLVDPARRVRLEPYPIYYANAVMWEPYWGRWSGRYRTDLGYFYSPLIELDRRFVHPSKYMEDPDWEEWFKAVYEKNQHPTDHMAWSP